MSEEFIYITEVDMSDRSKAFYNRRTGEVVPAGSEQASGKVWKGQDGNFYGGVYDETETTQHATEADAVRTVARG